VKGVTIGVTLGVWGYTLELSSAWALYVLYAMVGLLSGLLGGRPPWRHANPIPPAAKVVFSVGVCLGITWLGALANGGFGTPSDRTIVALPEVFAPLLALLCGILLEVDDGEAAPPRQAGARRR